MNKKLVIYVNLIFLMLTGFKCYSAEFLSSEQDSVVYGNIFLTGFYPIPLITEGSSVMQTWLYESLQESLRKLLKRNVDILIPIGVTGFKLDKFVFPTHLPIYMFISHYSLSGNPVFRKEGKELILDFHFYDDSKHVKTIKVVLTLNQLSYKFRDCLGVKAQLNEPFEQFIKGYLIENGIDIKSLKLKIKYKKNEFKLFVKKI